MPPKSVQINRRAEVPRHLRGPTPPVGGDETSLFLLHRQLPVPEEVLSRDVSLHHRAMIERFFKLAKKLTLAERDHVMRCYPEVMADALFRSLRFCFPYLKENLTSSLYKKIYEELTYLTTGVERSEGYIVPREPHTGSKKKTRWRRLTSFRASIMDSAGPRKDTDTAVSSRLHKGLTSEQMLFKRELDEIMKGRHRAGPLSLQPQLYHTQVPPAAASGSSTKAPPTLPPAAPQYSEEIQRLIADLENSLGPRDCVQWYEEGRGSTTRCGTAQSKIRTGHFNMTKISPIIRFGLQLWDIDLPPPISARGTSMKWTL